jgi:hypothetical protein
MRLVLAYTGLLPPNGNAQEKHRIRKAFHPQLKKQWVIDPALAALANTIENGRNGLDKIADLFQRGTFRFVPLVMKNLSLVCSLEILLLRNEVPGGLVKPGGDIDNRIKTLFDSLSFPNHANQLQGQAADAEENPFYCLLEDDSLITGFQIKTERLLQPLGANPDEISLLLTITVRPTTVTTGNIGFLGGWL